MGGVTSQPDRDKDTKEWIGNPNYSGDKNAAGNRFYLDCTIDGKSVSIAFFHLQAGTPVSINPRTGQAFKKGDEVYQGEIIGYVGKTGNAYKVPNSHLHFGVRDSSGWIDPGPYFNGEVDKDEKGTVSSAEIINIICNEDRGWVNALNNESTLKSQKSLTAH